MAIDEMIFIDMKKYIGVLFFFYLVAGGCRAQTKVQGTGKPAAAGDAVWPAVKKEMRPWTRWWWMGSAVDDSNLDKLLTQYRHAGFGGVEITPIYGAVGYESRYVPFLSPEWMDRLSFTVKKAASLGMGVDMNTGTGWPFGGPQVSREHAAARLILRRFSLASGETLSPGSLQSKDPLQALIAYGPDGQTVSLRDKLDQAGLLGWSAPAANAGDPAGSGNWTVLAAYSGKTEQRVKRAAPGGEGYVMDHFDTASVDGYLERFTNAFHGKAPGVQSFFNDSYEVYAANWTPGLFDRFRELKGYDLRNYLRDLDSTAGPSVAGLSAAGSSATGLAAGPVTEPADRIGRVKSDYREVYGDLLLHNFTGRWNDWAHRMGAVSRNQAHGSPGNLLDLYAAADIPECEGFFGLSQFEIPGLPHDPMDIRSSTPHNPNVFKFASSAAHFYGKPLTSSETFVWLTEHFRTSLAECKPEVEQLFLAGINHVFFHGTTYSPQDIPWPGWIFYASAEFVPANSLWPQLPGMNEYITRCQSVLQAGRADNQLQLYWPIYDLWDNPKGMEIRFAMNNVEDWLYPSAFNAAATRLHEKGYSVDFVSDKMIADRTDGSNRQVVHGGKPLLIPRCRLMPLATLEKIIRLAKAGATVVFESLPEDVPGLADLAGQRERLHRLLKGFDFRYDKDSLGVADIGSGRILVGALTTALEYLHIEREELRDQGLQYIRRDLGDGKYYYLVNHTAHRIEGYIPLSVPSGAALIMDPLDGRCGRAETRDTAGKMKVRLQMEPGEALIVRTGNSTALPAAVKAWEYLGQPGVVRTLTGPWSLAFTTGGPVLPAGRKLDNLSYWNELPDSAAAAFSGTGVYTTQFVCKDLSAGEYLLELKGVKESARVRINGKEAGIAWSFPFRLRVKDYLHTGRNTISIEVVNLMANRIRDMDRKGIRWRNYHEINFVSIQYKPFDASHWQPLSSGLSGPVTITSYATDGH
jgi:hypothetical protein